MREHGTRARYRAGCRCEDCRRANREYNREWHRERSLKLGKKRRVAKHGTESKYMAGCRCRPCIDGRNRARNERSYRKGEASPRVDAAVSRELVACMMAFGLTRPRLSVALNVAYRTLQFKRPTIIRRTADRIEGLHWGLFMRHGPFRRHCQCEWTVEVRDFMEAA